MSQGPRDESPISVVTMMSVLAKRVLLSTPPPPPGAPPRASRREDNMSVGSTACPAAEGCEMCPLRGSSAGEESFEVTPQQRDGCASA